MEGRYPFSQMLFGTSQRTVRGESPADLYSIIGAERKVLLPQLSWRILKSLKDGFA